MGSEEEKVTKTTDLEKWANNAEDQIKDMLDAVCIS